MSAWTDFVERWKDCQLCPLAQQRHRICLARGDLPCDVLFVGEAPGASEDALGAPFVGPAGHLLDRIIANALDASTTYALTNLVCCFPREAKMEGINEPHHTEIKACRKRLIEFVNIAQPRLMVCVGSLAVSYVNHGDTISCIDVIHPAAILRMPLAQRQMATQRCVVQIRTAAEELLQSRTAFTTWGESYAKTSREALGIDFAAALKRSKHTEDTSAMDNIPF